MSNSSELGFDRLLALVGRSAPGPFYPSEFAKATGIDRGLLDPPLEQLRLARLIEFTPWESGRGQGLRPTLAGEQVLASPRLMDKLSRAKLPTPEERAARDDLLDQDTTYGRGEAVRRALLYPVAPRVTQVLIALSVVVFLFGQVIALQGNNPGVVQFGDARALELTGAINGADLVHGQWWRLLSCCFVHIGAIHLFMNMYSLWMLGPVSERLWGRWRYLGIYLLAGVTGSCAAMFRHPQSLVAGASGCIWGVMAALLVWTLLNRQHLPRQLVSDWTRQLGMAVLLNAAISFLPGISAEAHFAGGAAGAAIAILLNAHRFGRGAVRWLSVLGVILVPLVSLAALIWAMENTFTWQRYTQVVRAVDKARLAPADENGKP